MKTILERRSIRKYTDKEVTVDTINELLKCAMQAPSACNCQPWEFVVSDSKEDFEKVKSVDKFARMLPNASKAIVVCGNLEKEVYPGFWVQDCSAATQNILLKAHDMGLGAVWLGIHPQEDLVNHIKEIFDLPENIEPLGIISIGYPGEEKGFEDRFDETKIHYNKYKK